MQNKRSFFERLTGAVRIDDDMGQIDVHHDDEVHLKPLHSIHSNNAFEERDEEAQLTVDVYQTSSSIVIKTMVAGVKPDDLDVLITRDSVTIKGRRTEDRTLSSDEYVHRELYWGSFSRTVDLPEEIDVDSAEAVEKHGMLILTLPKLDKNRQAKLRVKG